MNRDNRMEKEKINLFMVLLKLKSYLVSMIDNRSEEYDNFNISQEYLSKKFPTAKEDIINILEDHGIYSDNEIAFSDKIILKFREIASEDRGKISLINLLTNLEIEARDSVLKDSGRSTYILEREKKLNEILDLIFQLATNWALLKELEDNVDDYSVLNEENVIRPEEEENLNKLDSTTTKAFENISNLTKQYIKLLTDYYFTYGGDVALKDFVDELENTKQSVVQKYVTLFKKFGLDTDWLSKYSK